MSRIKPIQVAGLKIIELAKKLRKRKYAKKSKKNVERARGVRTSKSVKAYNIRVKDKETKIIPVKRQSQKGSTFQIHRVRSKMGRAAAQSEEKGKLPSPTPTLDRLFKGDVQRGKLDDYRLTRMYLRNKLSDVAKKKFKGGIMNKRKLKKLVKKKGLPMPLMTKSKFKDAGKFPYVKKLTGGQAKLDKNKNNRIDAEDFKILRAEKAKGRGMGLQDEKLKPGKVKKAALGAAAVRANKRLSDKEKFEKAGGKAGRRDAAKVQNKMGGGMMMTPRGAMGAMGGGMMMKPMGYKAGKSVKVKCKIGRNKPTKMY
jgi:hypothetical protein